MYFKDFPSFMYDFNYEDGTTRTTVLKDVTRNIRMRKEILSNISLYDEYDLVDGDTPEIIAEKYYGNPEYHWIVMLANEKFDWLGDFPLTETEITKHIKSIYNPIVHAKSWRFESEYHAAANILEQKLFFVPYDNPLPIDPAYLTIIEYTVSGETDTMGSFSYTFKFPDVRHDEYHNGLDILKQEIWQILPYPIGTITCVPSTKIVYGTNTQFTTNLHVGMDLYTKSGVKIGRIATITSDTELSLQTNSTVAVTNVDYDYVMTGNPVGELVITTKYREFNPVFFVNSQGLIVNPGTEGATGLTGNDIHRLENDTKRKIKLVSPALIETVIKNYEELL